MAAARPFVCLECRARVAANEPCDCKHDRRVDVSTREGRSELVSEVWGKPSMRRNAKEAARAAGTGAGVGASSNLLDCFDCGGLSSPGCGSGTSSAGSGLDALGEAGVFIAVVLVAALAAVILYFLIRWIVHRINEYRNRPRPHGALYRPPPMIGAGVQGRVVASAKAIGGELAPSGNACLAWTCELRHKRVIGEGAMLRDGGTRGFEIELDDRRRVRVPQGRLRIEARPQRIAREVIARSRYLIELDPQGFAGMPADDDPFPFDLANEIRLSTGDRVELVGPLTLRIDESLSEPGYREAAGALVPEGLPLLRKLSEGARF